MAEGDAAGVMPGQEVEDAGRYDLDADRLARYLAAQGFGFQRLEAVRKFATGQSNPTFRLDAQPQRYVMRCKPRGKLVPSAHMIEREYAVFRALAQSPVPVPRVLHYCTDTSVVGSEFFVMEFILGRVFAEPALSDAPPSDRRPMYEDALRVLAAIHSVDPAAVPFRRAGAKQQAGQGFYQRQIKRFASLCSQQEAGGGPALPCSADLFRWAEARLPEPAPDVIVHGDFKMDNLLFAPDAPRVRAVLDWELSTIGHPLSDLANFCLYYVLPDSLPIATLAGTPPPGVPTCEECLRHYHAVRGVAPPSTQDWQFALVFAVLKMAVILQGVAFRAGRGQASSNRALLFGGFAGQLADAAWSVAQVDADRVPGGGACRSPGRARL